MRCHFEWLVPLNDVWSDRIETMFWIAVIRKYYTIFTCIPSFLPKPSIQLGITYTITNGKMNENTQKLIVVNRSILVYRESANGIQFNIGGICLATGNHLKHFQTVLKSNLLISSTALNRILMLLKIIPMTTIWQ